MKTLAIALALTAAPFVAAHADDSMKPKTVDKTATAKLATSDLAVLGKLHHVNQMEIDMAKVAAKQGTASLKDYTQTLITDHTSNDKDLLALVKKRGGTLPSAAPVTAEEKAEKKDMDAQMAKLMKLKGAEFDTAYLAMMVAGHDGVVAKIDVALAATTDDDVKNYLTMTKPAVQLHAKRARDLQAGTPKS